MISSSQKLLPDNTRHSQPTNIHAPSEIRTHNLSRQAAVDLRLRLRGNWDRQLLGLVFLKGTPLPSFLPSTLQTQTVYALRYIHAHMQITCRSLSKYATHHEDIRSEAGGQLHTPDTLGPGEEPQLLTVQLSGWGLQCRSGCRIHEQYFCPCRESNRTLRPHCHYSDFSYPDSSIGLYPKPLPLHYQDCGPLDCDAMH